MEDTLARLGLEVTAVTENEVWARCPAHLARAGKEDRHPSFSVNADTGLFSCFSCGYRGTLTTLAADVLALQPAQASAWVAQGVSLGRVAERLRATGRVRPPAVSCEPDLAGFVLPPVAALAARGLDDDAAARFGVLWDARENAFILPIRAPGGALLGYQYKRGRYVRNRPRGVAKSRTLFGLHALDGDTAVLVESPLDAARLWAAGVPGAVASFGAAVSDTQIELLVAAADTVIIALDNPGCDEAGAVNTPLVEARLAGRVRTLFFRYPDNQVKDPGDMTDKQIGDGIDRAFSALRQRISGW